MMEYEKCTRCDGEGTRIDYRNHIVECHACNSSGIVEAKLTIRDQFAMAALTGALACGHISQAGAPGAAYRLADAMLEERLKKEGKS